MGSKVKQIRKRAQKFHNALEIFTKNLDAAQSQTVQPNMLTSYDLTSAVQADVDKALANTCKERNKRKAERKKRWHRSSDLL